MIRDIKFDFVTPIWILISVFLLGMAGGAMLKKCTMSDNKPKDITIELSGDFEIKNGAYTIKCHKITIHDVSR